MVTRTGSFAFFFPLEKKNYCVAAVETGGKQGSPGALHLIFRFPYGHEKRTPANAGVHFSW